MIFTSDILHKIMRTKDGSINNELDTPRANISVNRDPEKKTGELPRPPLRHHNGIAEELL